MMYRKYLYDPHNESLDRFIKKFNSAQIYPNLIAVRCPQENFKHDAIFINMDNLQAIGFDWSKSPQVLFVGDKWKYKEYTLIASKYEIESSDLYITTDANEQQVLTLWRKDIDTTQLTYFMDHAGQGGDTLRPAYKTNAYRIFSLESMEVFKIYVKNSINLYYTMEDKINENY